MVAVVVGVGVVGAGAGVVGVGLGLVEAGVSWGLGGGIGLVGVVGLLLGLCFFLTNASIKCSGVRVAYC